MDYKISLGLWGGVFAVPFAVTDEYIKLASGDNLKVLLYCLRHSDAEITDGEISRATGVKAENVKTSMEFWEQRGLFAERKNTDNHERALASVRKVESKREPAYSQSDVAGIIRNDKTLKYIYEKIEEREGTVNFTAEQVLTQLTEYYQMKPEVLLMLVEYSFSTGKYSPAYIKRAALDWIDKGIDTVVKAEALLKEIEESQKLAQTAKKTKKTRKIRKTSIDLEELNRQIMEEYGDI